MDLYGDDKPDLRFGMLIAEVTSIFRGERVPRLQQALAAGELSAASRCEGVKAPSRKVLDELVGLPKAWAPPASSGWSGRKAVPAFPHGQVLQRRGEAGTRRPWAEAGEAGLLMVGSFRETSEHLARLRKHCVEMSSLGPSPSGRFSGWWIFRSSNGTPRRSATSPATTPSPAAPRVPRGLEAIAPWPSPTPTTSC